MDNGRWTMDDGRLLTLPLTSSRRDLLLTFRRHTEHRCVSSQLTRAIVGAHRGVDDADARRAGSKAGRSLFKRNVRPGDQWNRRNGSIALDDFERGGRIGPVHIN